MSTRSPLLTPTEVAARLRISRRKAYSVMREMVHVEDPRLLVTESALDRYIEARTKEPIEWNSQSQPVRRAKVRTTAAQAQPVALGGSNARKPIEVRTSQPKPTG